MFSISWVGLIADHNLGLPRRNRGVRGMRTLGRRDFASPKDAARFACRGDVERGGGFDPFGTWLHKVYAVFG